MALKTQEMYTVRHTDFQKFPGEHVPESPRKITPLVLTAVPQFYKPCLALIANGFDNLVLAIFGHEDEQAQNHDSRLHSGIARNFRYLN